jgi:uncharacterized membrane protein YfcA
LDLIEIVKIGSVMILGGIIQSSSGFGFGLFAIPILLFFGFDLPTTVTMVVIGSAIQKVAAVKVLREHLEWRELLPFFFTGLAVLPLGVYAMSKLSAMDQSVVKQLIGAVVFLLLVLRWKGTIKSREKVPRIWGYIAGFFSGFLNGLANIGGPPLVLWILAHKWSNHQMRVTVIAFSLLYVPFQLGLMLLTFGTVILNPMLKAVLLCPTVLAGTWIGLKIGERISKEHLAVYMQVLLFFIAVSAIAKPFF